MIASIRRTIIGIVISSTVLLGEFTALTAPAEASASKAELDLIPWLYPATHQEWNSGTRNELTMFISQVSNISTYKCMRSRGYSESDVGYLLSNASADKMQPDITQYPDAAAIASGKEGIPLRALSPGTSLQPAPGSVEATPAFDQAMTSCEGRKPKLVNAIDRAIYPLQKTLAQMSGGYLSSPQVTSATTAWSKCMAAGGVQAQSVQDFMGYMNTLTQANKTDPITPQFRSDMKLYGRCVGPLSNAMDSVRLADRAKFEDQYGAQITQAEAEVTKDINQLASQYGLKAPR